MIETYVSSKYKIANQSLEPTATASAHFCVLKSEA